MVKLSLYLSFRSAYKKYKDLYKKHVEFPIDQSFKEKLREAEENLDVFNIFLAREQAKLEVSLSFVEFFILYELLELS